LGMDPEALSVTARWTAPAAGTWSLAGFFQGIDTQERSHNVAIVENGNVSLLDPTNLFSYGQQVPFNLTVTLKQGDTVDFLVASTGASGNLSTGLSVEVSQPYTVTWTDANDGNVPTSAAWTDRVVVTNTTTGHVLATADLPYDPSLSGPIAPGGSAAR